MKKKLLSITANDNFKYFIIDNNDFKDLLNWEKEIKDTKIYYKWISNMPFVGTMSDDNFIITSWKYGKKYYYIGESEFVDDEWNKEDIEYRYHDQFNWFLVWYSPMLDITVIAEHIWHINYFKWDAFNISNIDLDEIKAKSK